MKFVFALIAAIALVHAASAGTPLEGSPEPVWQLCGALSPDFFPVRL